MHEHKVQIPALAKRHADLPLERLQDAFLASSVKAGGAYDNEDAWICRSIIGQYLKKPLFGETRLALPKELRDAYLAAGHRQPRAAFVAQLIDPPFPPGELEHIVSTDRSSWFGQNKGTAHFTSRAG